MLFEGLNKIRRQTIMTAITLMLVGVVMLICPDRYVDTLIHVFGVIMLIAACVMILNFLNSNKSLINYILLAVAFALGIIGAVILVLDYDIIFVLAILFGIGLIADGIYSLLHALVFARRSERKGWWVMVILSALLILFGLIIGNNPAWETPEELMRIIGLMFVGASIVSILRLIWIWPIKNV